ncbi:MAG TPA: hypothetical protein VII72_13710 [Myxococcota bacterium]
MRTAPFATAACAFALLVSSPTLASIPGNIQEKAREGLLHVCRDVEPGNVNYHVCDEQVSLFDPQSPYTGSECTAAGLPPICRIDFIPNVRLTGNMTLIDDDLPLDGDGLFNGNAQATMILNLKFDWKVLTLIESFEGTKIGNWNPFDEFGLADPTQEIEYTNSPSTAFQFSNGNLVELGLEIRDIAQTFYPSEDLSGAVPVLTSIVRNPSKSPVDASGNGLGTAGYFQVVVRFARVRP